MATIEKKFLDQEGVQHLWDKIAAQLATKVNINEIDIVVDALTNSEIDAAILEAKQSVQQDN